MRKATINFNSIGVFSNFKYPFIWLTKDRIRTLPGNDTKKYHFLQNSLMSVGRNNEKRILSNFRKMDDEFNFSDVFENEISTERRLSTCDDVKVVLSLLKEIINYRENNVSHWIIESKVKKLCGMYKCFLRNHKNEFIQVLAKDYSLNHTKIFQTAQALGKFSEISVLDNKNEAKIIKSEEQLKNLLTPQYSWLFLHIGKLEKGVKFLVDLRTDILDFISERNVNIQNTTELQQLNITLRELLSLWFSIGFLHLERVTWSSSCEMLQKISEYEAVHPVRSWTDLKRRVGPYRRCFVFLHGSMPGEPIVVLHTALCDEISSSMKGIVSPRSRKSDDFSSEEQTFVDPQEEDPECIKAAVFYSIASTQKGLKGIELGNYLIKSVVCKLQNEFPQMTQFSSLSPIPNFKSWLIEKLKSVEKGQNDILFPTELDMLKNYISSSNYLMEFRRMLLTNSWVDDKKLVEFLEQPLMRLCTRYLYIEKRRGYAFDSVANFHLKNGAVMWRLNWQADLSPRGLGNSCSLMVNYRYFLEDTEFNSRYYLEKQLISASEQILKLAGQAQQLMMATNK